MFFRYLSILSLVIITQAFRCPPEDGHYPKQGDCKAFYKCYKGKPALLRCPANLYFNADAQVCDWLANVNCDLVSIEVPDKNRRRGYKLNDSETDAAVPRRKPGIRRRKLRRKPSFSKNPTIDEPRSQKAAPRFVPTRPFPYLPARAQPVHAPAIGQPQIVHNQVEPEDRVTESKVVTEELPTDVKEEEVKMSEDVIEKIQQEEAPSERVDMKTKENLKASVETKNLEVPSIGLDKLVRELVDTYGIKSLDSKKKVVDTSKRIKIQNPRFRVKPIDQSQNKRLKTKTGVPNKKEQVSSHKIDRSRNVNASPKKMLFFGKPSHANIPANRFVPSRSQIASQTVLNVRKTDSVTTRLSSAQVAPKRQASRNRPAPTYRPAPTQARPVPSRTRPAPRTRPTPPRARLTQSDNGYTPFSDNGKNVCGKESKEPITDEIRKLRKISCMASNTVVKRVKPRSASNPPNVKILESIFSEEQFDEVFPKAHRAYTYENFLKAFAKFPEVCSDELLCRYTLATMFAHFKQETDDLYYLEEINKSKYCGAWSDWLKEAYPCSPGRKYYGRGSKQLSWNYNYGAFSNAMFGDSKVLLENPDWVADTWLNFASALWFYATPQPPKPSMLAVVHQTWEPSSEDLEGGRTYGFGVTTMIVNGGIECGEEATNQQGSRTRQAAYIHYAKYFDIDIRGEKLDCTDMEAFDATGSSNPSIYWAPEHGCTPATWQTAYSALVEGDYERCMEDIDAEYYEYYDDLY